MKSVYALGLKYGPKRSRGARLSCKDRERVAPDSFQALSSVLDGVSVVLTVGSQADAYAPCVEPYLVNSRCAAACCSETCTTCDSCSHGGLGQETPPALKAGVG